MRETLEFGQNSKAQIVNTNSNSEQNQNSNSDKTQLLTQLKRVSCKEQLDTW